MLYQMPKGLRGADKALPYKGVSRKGMEQTERR